MTSRDFLAGKLLIAMPNMTDPRFEKALVLICSHDEEHAMGVVVNKPLKQVELGELLEQLGIDPKPGASGEPVHYGGPVRSERGLVVHSLDYQLETTMEVSERIGLTASQEILSDIAGVDPKRDPPAHSFLAVGHAGWGPGQLESEITANAWAHCEADDDLVFAETPSEAWRIALERLGVTAAMLSSAWSTTRSADERLN
ncbi:MAG: YqgE/AlgH family protein [Pseudomonadota bacterium]